MFIEGKIEKKDPVSVFLLLFLDTNTRLDSIQLKEQRIDNQIHVI